MRYEFINPFIDSTIKVLDTVLDSDIRRGDFSLADGYEIDGEISILINLTGDSDGTVVVNMSAGTALNVCNVMTYSDSSSLTELKMDAISELANMIAGRAVSALNDLGFEYMISPPLIAKKNEIRAETAETEMFLVPLFTEYGEITMNIAIKNN